VAVAVAVAVTVVLGMGTAAGYRSLLKKSWNSAGKERNAPHLLALIDRFNSVSVSVCAL